MASKELTRSRDVSPHTAKQPLLDEHSFGFGRHLAMVARLVALPNPKLLEKLPRLWVSW